MADDKEKKGVINNYNQIPTTVMDYYYDKDETDKKLRKDIGDNLVNLTIVNNKLKKELDAEKKTKVEIEKPEK